MRIIRLACALVCALAASAQIPKGGGSSGGGGGSVGSPYETTGTGTSVSITAATHGKGTKPIWGPGSCVVTSTGAQLTSFAPVVNVTTGDVTATWTGSTAYTCRVFASGQQGPAGPSGSGSGDVVGPASSTDNQIVLFDSTTGKLIKASTGNGYPKLTTGVPSMQSTIPQADVTNLTTDLAAKAAKVMTAGVLKTDSSGNTSVVSGTSSNCVKVDGTSGTCGSGGTYTNGFGLTLAGTEFAVDEADIASNDKVRDGSLTLVSITSSSGTTLTGRWTNVPASYDVEFDVTAIVVASNTATATIYSHGLSLGQKFRLTGATTDTDLNAIWTVATVPSVDTFTFTTASVADGTYNEASDSSLKMGRGGRIISLQLNATLSGTPTLNVDGIGAKNMYKADGTTAATGTSGEVQSYMYDIGLNSNAGGWRLVSGGSSSTIRSWFFYPAGGSEPSSGALRPGFWSFGGNSGTASNSGTSFYGSGTDGYVGYFTFPALFVTTANLVLMLPPDYAAGSTVKAVFHWGHGSGVGCNGFAFSVTARAGVNTSYTNGVASASFDSAVSVTMTAEATAVPAKPYNTSEISFGTPTGWAANTPVVIQVTRANQADCALQVRGATVGIKRTLAAD